MALAFDATRLTRFASERIRQLLHPAQDKGVLLCWPRAFERDTLDAMYAFLRAREHLIYYESTCTSVDRDLLRVVPHRPGSTAFLSVQLHHDVASLLSFCQLDTAIRTHVYSSGTLDLYRYLPTVVSIL